MMAVSISLPQQEAFLCWGHKPKAVRKHQELIYHNVTLQSCWFGDNHTETSLAPTATAGKEAELLGLIKRLWG